MSARSRLSPLRPGVLKDLKTMGSVNLFIFFITLLVLARQVSGSLCTAAFFILHHVFSHPAKIIHCIFFWTVSVSLVRGLRHSTVEPGHLRQLGRLLRFLSVHPPLFIPTDADLVPFLFFGGLPFIIWAPKQMLGTECSPRRICWWKWGSAITLILGHYQVKGGWGGCSWNITAAVNLLLSYCYCQLRSYYSLIESSPRRWWVEINLSIIVKGLWQSERATVGRLHLTPIQPAIFTCNLSLTLAAAF